MPALKSSGGEAKAGLRRSLKQFLTLCGIALAIWLFGSYSQIQAVSSNHHYLPSIGASLMEDDSSSAGEAKLIRAPAYVEDALESELRRLQNRRGGGETFSAFEIVDSTLPLFESFSKRLEGSVWLASLPESEDWAHATTHVPAVRHLSKAKLRWLYQSPQLFDALFLLDLDSAEAEYAPNEADWLVLALSLAKRTYLRSKARTLAKVEAEVRETLSRVGPGIMKARVTRVKTSDVLRIDLLHLDRKVLSHYRDKRPAKHGGSCPVYSLLYQAVPVDSADNDEDEGGAQSGLDFQSNQWLWKLGKAKGGVAGCELDVRSERRCVQGARAPTNVTMTHPWIEADVIAGLGATPATSSYLMRSFMGLPERPDCFLWNVCLVRNLRVAWCEFRSADLGHSSIERKASRGESNIIAKDANSACVKFESNPKHMTSSACCIDVALLRLFGCSLEKNFIHQLTTGQAMDESVSLECRKKHVERYLFREVKFKSNYLESAQTAFIFGEGIEPSRMTKQELILELKYIGVPITSSMNKELLIEKLETERLKVTDLTEDQVVSELKRYHLSASGQLTELKYRLQNIRNNNYLAHKLRRGSKVNKGTMLPDMDPRKMSKEMLLKELRNAYGLATQGTKAELIQRIEAARQRHPRLFEKYMDDLQDLASVAAAVPESGKSIMDKPLSEMSKQELTRELERFNIKPKGNKYDMLEQLMKEKQKRLERASSASARPSKSKRQQREGGSWGTSAGDPGNGGGSDQDVIPLSAMSKNELETNLEVLGVTVEKGSQSKAALAKLLVTTSLERLNVSKKAKADSLNKSELQKILQKFGFSTEGTKEILQSRIVHQVLLQILQ